MSFGYDLVPNVFVNPLPTLTLERGFGFTLRTMTVRPARVCIEFGLARTRTVHFETCTV